MLTGFKKFILRGNVVDFAVAVVIGTAFSAVVTALVADLFTPLIAALVGTSHFASLKFTLNHSVFAYGDVVNHLISFIVIAGAVYLFVVAPLNALNERRHRNDPAVPEELPADVALLTEIRDLLARETH